MAPRPVARLGTALILILGTTGGLLAASGPAEAKAPPNGTCVTTFQSDLNPGVGVSAYNYQVCTYSNGSWSRTNGPAFIEKNGVLVSGSTTGKAPFLGNSGPGYAGYVCNGSTGNSFFFYGPGTTTGVACG